MNDDTRKKTPTGVRGRLPLLAALLFGLTACALSAVDVKVQDWWAARGPVVPHDSFPADCTLCHTGTDWNTIREDFEFDHELQTGVALTGAHARAECIRCHNDRGPVEVFAARGCAGCHENVHRGQLGDRCIDCHTEQDWRPRESIAEHARTGFPLIGAHAGVSCWQCHAGAEEGIFSGVSTDCASCHAADALAATSVDHLAQGWTSSCDDCHALIAWTQSGFKHTGFALAGAHAAADCSSCHVGAVFAGTPSDCAACHLAEYQATTEPAHAAAGFPQDCQACHDANDWDGASFSHTSFALNGAHAAANCSQCHVGGVFAGTPSDCAGCHLGEFQATTEPAHAAAGFSQDCQTCHNVNSWDGATFAHTAFALTGAHTMADCSQCHIGGVFAGTPNDCSGCHLAEFQATTDPNHVTTGFPQSCDVCHQTFAWERASFDHTSFPLTGSHAGADCTQCHVGGVYAGTPTDCASCHQADYLGTTDPNHVAAGFPQSCESCHNTNTWDGAQFDHSSFPLTGSHVGADCAQCHVGGVFAGTPNNCSACHLGEYQATTDPNHSNLGFPTSCDACHTTFMWEGATFDHSFPIETGKHKNLDCADCHTTPMQYSNFSCTHCHDHRQSEMDDKHDDENGYVWSSPACYSCHPDGKADD
jgi:hypothetical protein